MFTCRTPQGDPDRQAQARVELTVKGKPRRPHRGDGQPGDEPLAIIKLAPAANNGEQITHYTVTSVQGPAVSQGVPGDDLHHHGAVERQDYRFAVTATNAVGESDASLKRLLQFVTPT